jgi:hypothetical protein
MFNSSPCVSVLNGRSLTSLFESHVPLRPCVEWAYPENTLASVAPLSL